MTRHGIILHGVRGLPLVQSGDKIADLLFSTLQEEEWELQENDILVIAHTIVSKAEGRVVNRDEVRISKHAAKIASENGFDPVHVELALQESSEIIRSKGVLITETVSGYICNFSGVDRSNAPEESFLLLPLNPDHSAARIRAEIMSQCGFPVAVIISDTQGRPWRRGSVNVAIGCAGINAFHYNRGRKDLYGRTLERSTICQVDELASAAEPLMGQADEGVPIVIIRGYSYMDGTEECRHIHREKESDLFR
ncbi:MAG: coenzyme F420-0:L-glutamate ligase [Candidatus Hodarchaeota archaeon]